MLINAKCISRLPAYQCQCGRILRTAKINSTSLLVLVEICFEMTILQQVEIVVFMPYFRSIATHTVCLLHKYEAHIKGFPMFPRFTSKE